MSIEISKDKYNNLTREERGALSGLKNDKTVVIKGTDKGSAVVFWDRDVYIQEAVKQLDDKEIYEEVSNDPQPLINAILRAVEKIRKRGDLTADNIKYFIEKDQKVARFYLLPKIHKRLGRSIPDDLLFRIVGFVQKTFQPF